MRATLILIAFAGALVLTAQAQVTPETRPGDWPQWRGPAGTGVAPHADPPVEWSESRNIRWKVRIPGRGHASPIVWGDRVYVQTALKADKPAQTKQPDSGSAQGHDRPAGAGSDDTPPAHAYQFAILALDRHTGKTIWQRTLCEVPPHERGHDDASQASNSPATDGQHIIAYFGSRGLYCLDMQGQVVWEQQLGQMQTRRGFGEGSSPALHGDTVVVTWDHEGQSFSVAFDKATGRQRWKVERDEPTSWASPVVIAAGGKRQVVASATNQIRSYDLHTGDLLWQCGGLTGNVIPTPVYDNSLLFCTSGFRGSALLAIRYADARGDIAGSDAVAWVYDGKGTPYVPSPLLYDDYLYFLQENREALSCVAARSGKPHYAKQRLEGLRGVYASPVGAQGRVYIVGRNGVTAVIQHGPEFKLLATNTLDDSFTASSALGAGEIFLRGVEHLYCIAAE